MASSSYSNSPCAACKFLRRKCLPDCIFAPYFPPEDPQKFFSVHKIFGASNVSKILNEVQPHQREDAVNSLAYEASERLKDPVYGCVGTITTLQRQLMTLQSELEVTRANLVRLACRDLPARRMNTQGAGAGGPFDQQNVGICYPYGWNNNPSSNGASFGEGNL